MALKWKAALQTVPMLLVRESEVRITFAAIDCDYSMPGIRVALLMGTAVLLILQTSKHLWMGYNWLVSHINNVPRGMNTLQQWPCRIWLGYLQVTPLVFNPWKVPKLYFSFNTILRYNICEWCIYANWWQSLLSKATSDNFFSKKGLF